MIEKDLLPGYNKFWKPERQTTRRLPGKNQLVILFFIGICTVALLLGVVQQASAKSENQRIGTGSLALMQLERVSHANVYIEPGEVQGDHNTYETAQPEIWYGLAASLSGALVMGLSFLVLQRQAVE
ncbi:MAG: hypothetical protein EHM21_04450 [Chloroflexi bacterium]|nr:MAG: hypothetical protein EHM21_04450 [Chloroflexota bacterium]